MRFFFRNIILFLLLVWILVLYTACNNNATYRFIDATDTTFSSDIRSVSKKINENPTNPELFYNRAKAFYFEDKYNDAIIDIKHAIYLDSLNPLYHYTLAEYLMAGDTAEAKTAIKSYEKAISIKKDYVEAMLHLAKIQFARQNYAKAQENYFNASKLDPSNPIPYFYMGLMKKEMKDTAAAVALFEKTLAIDGSYYDAVMQLANYYMNKNDSRCLDFYNKAIKLNEFSDEAFYNKGYYYQINKQYKNAASMYEHTIKISKVHILARYNLAYINVLFKNYDEARGLLSEVIELDQNNAAAYALRGYIKEISKDFTGANMDYQKALQLDNSLQVAKDGLKRVKVIISS